MLSSSSSARRRTARTSSTASGREITRRLIARAGLHRRGGRGRLAGRLPRQPLSCAARATTPRPCDGAGRTSSASRPGCGATPTCSISSAGCAPTTTAPPGRAQGRLLRPRPLQPARLDARRCSPICDKVDPEAARRARERYACFEHFGEDPQAYGYAAGVRARAVVRGRGGRAAAGAAAARGRVRRARRPDRRGRAASSPSRTRGSSERRAVLPHDVPRARSTSWNLRDRHMADTLDALLGAPRRAAASAPKVVVWAHNSHLGDARATEMGDAGELNVGQLVRERHGARPCSVGFTTYTGTVTAASDWDAPRRAQAGAPGAAGSYEALFHEVGLRRFLLRLARARPAAGAARAAAGAGHRRGLPARRRSARATTSTRAAAAVRRGAALRSDAAVEPLERTPGRARGGQSSRNVSDWTLSREEGAMTTPAARRRVRDPG